MTDFTRATGYFGVPGSPRGRFTVHAVLDKRPLCGWRPPRDVEFQWCAWGYHWSYLECETCRHRVVKIMKAEAPT